MMLDVYYVPQMATGFVVGLVAGAIYGLLVAIDLISIKSVI